MEKKLMEKKAIIEVLEGMTGGLEWSLSRRKDEIKRHTESLKEDTENGVEIAEDDWRHIAIRAAQAYLDAYETVMKHLEKLI